MRWVLITALGSRVEPEVNRNLTMVSGPVACIAASTAGVGSVASNWANGVARRPSRLPPASTTSSSGATVAAMALP